MGDDAKAFHRSAGCRSAHPEMKRAYGGVCGYEGKIRRGRRRDATVSVPDRDETADADARGGRALQSVGPIRGAGLVAITNAGAQTSTRAYSNAPVVNFLFRIRL
jgi:hypothetical protein